MIKGNGVSIFSTFDGLRNINDELMESFNDKRAIVTDADARWTFIDGDVIKIGKRRFIKIVEKRNACYDLFDISGYKDDENDHKRIITYFGLESFNKW